jgi:PKD repeat protein
LDGPSGFCWSPGDHQTSSSDHVLMCYSMGNNAAVLEALPDETAILNRVLLDLDVTFGGTTASDAFIEGYAQNWTAEPYVLGAYSYPAPGTFPDVGDSMFEILADQVGTTLYFAGEATSLSKAATVPGAMLSGERAAGEINTDTGGPPAAGTPTANYSPSVTSGGSPLDVTFTDLSSDSPTGWSWDFGDTGTSSAQNPIHQYTTVGTYTVSLTATNSNGSHTRVLPNVISVPEPGATLQLLAGVVGLYGLNLRRRNR